MMNKSELFPVYIISKGRWENPITAKFFLKDKVPFKIAIEPQEFDLYSKTIPKENIEVLPFSNLGLGSFPARNWCWEHSIKNGHKMHFLFDDNLHGFYHLNNGKRTRVDCWTPLQTLQTLHQRYSNLAISGFNYMTFARAETKKPFYINCHVYSAMLIKNDLPFRWRLKYNEDIDLCLQALSRNLCTLNLNVFNVDKVSTATKMKGGNQDELYKNNDPRLKALKASSLKKVWPDYVKVVFKFGRPHHHISWNKYFTHPLKRILDKQD